MNFTLLIYLTDPTNDLPDEVHADAVQRHRALQEELGSDLLSVARLDEAPTGTTFRHDGERMPAVDGPYMESKEWLVGFYLIRCDSEEQAHERAKMICTPNHVIEVRPVRWAGDP